MATRTAPDVVFAGGRLFTAGWSASRAAALAVRDGRITAVGDDSDVRDLADAGTQVVELEGALLIPAFHDAHAHPVAGGLELLQCDVSAAADADDCLATIARYATAHPEVPWIQGGGWTMPHFAGGTPTAVMLDAIVPDRPVALQNRDHHGLWVNSAGLAIAGITAATPDPADGRIERDSNGAPSGVLHEGAMRLMEDVAPGVDDDLAMRGLIRAQREFFALGVVGWQDAWVGRTGGIDDILETYLQGLDAGALRARVTAALWWERDRGLEQLDGLIARRDRVAAQNRPELLAADTVKIMLDGVAENFTAAMSRPYLDGCGHGTDNAGLTFITPEALPGIVVALDAAGFHVHFHALGDRAVTLALDALAAAETANGPRAGRRHHLAHLQVVAEQDVPRFAALGATANLQMLWGALDPQVRDLTFPFLDAALIDRHYPFRDLRDAHAPLAAGSDWPVSSADPLAAIHVGVTRAEPGARADARMHPEQSLDLATALSAYTAGSATINGRGTSSGRLREGYLADLAVLSADVFAIYPHGLHEVAVRETWLAGDAVYRAGDS